ncbi:MAG TPA: TadE/TadG family type IV pilus assembly protein [Gemmatimonadales bacterium]|nr:TadE/TadG family type IV pilus assembly protein [Gemmatimonadales bacterium]
MDDSVLPKSMAGRWRRIAALDARVRPGWMGGWLPRGGQALVELAFVLPMSILLLLGAADLGRAFYEAEAIHQAVSAGALEAMNTAHVTACPSPCLPSKEPCFGDTGVTCANDHVLCAMTRAVPWPNGGDCRVPNSSDTIFLGTPDNPTQDRWVAADWDPNDAFTITMHHTFRFITPFLSQTKTLTLTSSITANRKVQ